MRIALAQLNLTIGDFAGNQAKILDAYHRGVEAKVDSVVCPELAITGYPPRDLLMRRSFVDSNLQTLQELATEVLGHHCRVV